MDTRCTSCGNLCVRPHTRTCCSLQICDLCLELFPNCDCRHPKVEFAHNLADELERNHRLYKHADVRQLVKQAPVTNRVSLSAGSIEKQLQRNRNPPMSKRDLVCYLDFESTDRTPLECRIVQIGAVMLDPDGNEQTFQTLVKADQPMCAAATEVTGIKDSDLHGAPACQPALAQFFEWLDRVRRGHNVVLSAYNGLSFDFPLLMSEMHRWSMSPYATLRRHGVVRFADALPWARVNVPSHRLIKKPSGEASFKLTDLHESMVGCRFEGAHDALADCKALRSVCEAPFLREKGYSTEQLNNFCCVGLKECVEEFQKRREGCDRAARAQVKKKVSEKAKRTILSLFKPAAEVPNKPDTSDAKRRRVAH